MHFLQICRTAVANLSLRLLQTWALSMLYLWWARQQMAYIVAKPFFETVSWRYRGILSPVARQFATEIPTFLEGLCFVNDTGCEPSQVLDSHLRCRYRYSPSPYVLQILRSIALCPLKKTIGDAEGVTREPDSPCPSDAGGG